MADARWLVSRSVLLSLLVAGAPERAAFARAAGSDGTVLNQLVRQPLSDQIEVDISVDPTTVDGNAWHGVGGVAILPFHVPMMPNLPTWAPSPLMCIVTLDGHRTCYGRAVIGMTHSLCVRSFDCEWTAVAPGGTFAILFLDEHAMGNKLIDAVIFSQRRLPLDDPERRRMDAIARSAASEMAPSVWPLEIERRERPFQAFLIDQCEAGCRLRQSKIGVTQER